MAFHTYSQGWLRDVALAIVGPPPPLRHARTRVPFCCGRLRKPTSKAPLDVHEVRSPHARHRIVGLGESLLRRLHHTTVEVDGFQPQRRLDYVSSLVEPGEQVRSQHLPAAGNKRLITSPAIDKMPTGPMPKPGW